MWDTITNTVKSGAELMKSMLLFLWRTVAFPILLAIGVEVTLKLLANFLLGVNLPMLKNIAPTKVVAVQPTPSVAGKNLAMWSEIVSNLSTKREVIQGAINIASYIAAGVAGLVGIKKEISTRETFVDQLGNYSWVKTLMGTNDDNNKAPTVEKTHIGVELKPVGDQVKRVNTTINDTQQEHIRSEEVKVERSNTAPGTAATAAAAQQSTTGAVNSSGTANTNKNKAATFAEAVDASKANTNNGAQAGVGVSA
ncbi:hypothetical protein [Rickettsiales endosymbiont of Stachyamoeba lipophora]|uniref:hypothetical protein n=1 Tax=Rickettsiales endosymbiont of Stachyamoeba lipophora TaxID=2486578 RepID=UPI000F645F93|nr:hypothetical protein [Rickettsiales endosymbiont of Stachyamoeba lipophora]AZL15123.1 hypothetical protein EF513_00905 [Rickettsiales endosymbiont of Stachyamoeba lipophora]